MEIKKSIEQGFAGGGLYDILVALNNGMGVLPVSGRTYYVNKTGNGTTGLSWETAFATIAAAISASNTYQALTENANGRNRIFVDGGSGYTEGLTVLPNECDIIGVGSTYGREPRITGNHAVTTKVTGCHIYNMYFYSAAAAAILSIPSNSNGFEIHNCRIQSSAPAATIGIQFGSLQYAWVDNCNFSGNPPMVTGIQIDGPVFAMSKITNNIISATTTGISVANGVTGDYGLVIRGNAIARMDPNSVAQMTYGIRYLDTNSRIHCFICENFISAVTYISHASGAGAATALANAMVGNRYAAAGDHYIDEHAVA